MSIPPNAANLVKQAGTFRLASGEAIYGELTLDGPSSSLYLRNVEDFSTLAIQDKTLHGTLHDLSKISLIQCITTQGTGLHWNRSASFYFAEVFPHYVTRGASHFEPDDNSVCEIFCTFPDASSVFYDFDAFGISLNPGSLIDAIVKGQQIGRDITTGDNPIIAYFTGKRDIIAFDSTFGRVVARHNPTYSIGGPNGVRIENQVRLGIRFDTNRTFHEAFAGLLVVLQYIGIVCGRAQTPSDISLRISGEGQKQDVLNLYWSMSPGKNIKSDEEKFHPADAILNAIDRPEEFSDVAKKWLNRHDLRRDARSRFSASISNGNKYTVDRLIGSANMFDLLSSEAVPRNVPLSDVVTEARERCRDIIKKLPKTIEIASVLFALSRMDKANLKTKIRHRSRIILDQLSDKFPDLDLVTDAAVDCRNRYVHGGDSRLDYESYFSDAVPFFIDSLEFVFGVSELIEAGWDAKTWSSTPTSMTHPFGSYRVTYRERLTHLKSFLATKSKRDDK